MIASYRRHLVTTVRSIAPVGTVVFMMWSFACSLQTQGESTTPTTSPIVPLPEPADTQTAGEDARPPFDAGAEGSALADVAFDAPPTRTAACLDRDKKMQVALNAKRRNRPADMLLQVTDEVCGQSFYATGPEPTEVAALSSRTQFRIGSITKPFVAVAILMNVADGRLSLDQRLDTALPSSPAAFAAVTVRHLLQHTSGIANYTNDQNWQAIVGRDPKRKWAPDELVSVAASKPLEFASGSKFAYSNTNYILLGQVLEQVEGKGLGMVLRSRILAPNNLSQTYLDGEEVVAGDWVRGRDRAGRDVTNRFDPSIAWAAGAMVSTTSDLSRFILALDEGKLVSSALAAEMIESTPTEQPGLGYGLGLFVFRGSITGNAGPGYGHGGDIAGYHSWSAVFPEKKTMVVGVGASDLVSGNDLLAVAIEQLF
jgi:D-alanyl-D-alanine carboxypeptidase